MAELSDDEKDRISHRGRAVRALGEGPLGRMTTPRTGDLRRSSGTRLQGGGSRPPKLSSWRTTSWPSAVS